MDELFSVIGRLYVDMTHAQKYIENLQTQLKEKDGEVINLKAKISSLSKDNDKLTS